MDLAIIFENPPVFHWKNSKVLMPRELAGDFKAVKRRPVKSEKTFMSVNGVSQQRVGQTGHVDTNLRVRPV